MGFVLNMNLLTVEESEEDNDASTTQSVKLMKKKKIVLGKLSKSLPKSKTTKKNIFARAF